MKAANEYIIIIIIILLWLLLLLLLLLLLPVFYHLSWIKMYNTAAINYSQII